MAHIAVIGGSVAGLAGALALARDGHRVTLLERDDTPFPPSPVEAFESWDRRGAPQVRHSHAFLARLRNLLRDRAPDVLAALVAAGARPLPFDQVLQSDMADAEPVPEDEDLVMLACRRITFEWVLHRIVLDEPNITLRDGVEVTGLLGSVDADGFADVRGVRLRSAAEAETALEADFVVDAGGRRSKLSRWLSDLGAPALEEHTEPCGIFYCSRFFRLRPGAETPPRDAVIGADLGYLKYGIFHGDSDIFSLTFAAPPEDSPLRQLLREKPFDAAAAALPATRPWVDPDVAEPITEVHGMAKLMNTRRLFLRDGRPIARGLAAVGDSAIHTNPMYGRGCTFALVHAWMFADGLREANGDREQTVVALEAAVEREIVPWYEFTLSQDRDAAALAKQIREGTADAPREVDPGAPVDPRAYMRDLIQRGLIPALRTDATVLRAFMRAMNLLEPPGDLLKDPSLLGRVLASYQQRDQREEPKLGPDRAGMIEILEAAA